MRYIQDKTEERKARFIFFIMLVIFFLGLILTMPAQKKTRQYNAETNKFVDSYCLNEPMKFSKVAGDTFLVTLRADNVIGDNYSFKAVVFFPKNIDITAPYKTLRVDFDELKSCILEPRIINRMNNSIEYFISLNQLAYFRYKKPTATCVEDFFCSKITWGQNVFSDFLADYLK